MADRIMPLSGIRVIDFTQVMLGPCATQMLGDFGADVLKIERGGVGDLSRGFFGLDSEEAMNNAVFASLNRNKRSVEIDTKSAEGRQRILDLVKTADLVVDNFRAPPQTIGGTHCDGTRNAVTQLLLHFQGQPCRFDFQRVVNLRHLTALELHINHRADNFDDLTRAHWRFLSISVATCAAFQTGKMYAPCYDTAEAPPTISEISCVMAAWRALL